MDELRLPAALESSEHVLVAGAGGGFDVYAGLPIYERLRRLGKKVSLANLGTPEEDMTSLAAVAGMDVRTRIVTCVGFGVDTFHGVCHANWLENVAGLAAEGAFLGATALLERMPEVRLYLDAVSDAEAATPLRPSIVNGSVASAIEGRFGDHHRTARTRGSKLFISPLMSLLWAFDLVGVARRNLYLERLAATESVWDVQLAIEGFHAGAKLRPREPIPH